jgi:hypothetical protein
MKKDQLREYQGDDTSLDIWLNESPINKSITWHNSRAFVKEGKCDDPMSLVIGHMIAPAKMRNCYAALDDETTYMPTDHLLDRVFYPT